MVDDAEGVGGGTHLAGASEVVEGGGHVQHVAAPVGVTTELLPCTLPQRLQQMKEDEQGGQTPPASTVRRLG